MFGKTHSAETKAKISATRGITIYVYDTKGTFVNTFSSTRRAALHFECSQTLIMKYLKNGKLLNNNWYISNNKDFLLSAISNSDSDK